MTQTQSTSPLPTGVVTFLLTDVAGSTRLWERQPELMTTVIARHYEILHAAVTANNGALPVEQGEGDSIVSVFRNGSEAIAAAFTAQQSLAAEPWPDDISVPVRMALHTGESTLRDAGNYAGETIIRTARLRALAHGCQVIASRQCVDLVGDAMPVGADWLDLGSYRLKDLGRPEQVFQLTHPDLVAEFPPLRGPDSVTNNLPTQLTPFIGREAELAQLHALLEDTRLLTVTGSGGCGKTRLALEAATDRIDRHVDGIWYVELAPLGETSSVVGALASVLHVQESAEETLLDAVVARLADARALVLIDNCEHLLAESAEVVEALLRGCPPLQVMTTSRQPLNLPGEVTWRVPSLRSPKASDEITVESLTQFDGVRLFIDRAVRSRPNFTVTNENAAHVAMICEQLDGIPLAIELAAARVRSVSVARIAEGLDDRFRLLRGGSSTLLPRQQTLYESIEWSHQLLEPNEQVLLRRLAMFNGGFTLDAAEAVCAFDPLDTYDVLDLLGSLVDRSLVGLGDDGATERYRLLETIKQFSRARLDEAGEVGDVLDRHLAHFAELAAGLAPDLQTGAQLTARPILIREADNLRVALIHASEGDDPEALGALAFDLVLFWFQTAQFNQGDHWLALAAEQFGDRVSPLLGRALWGRGLLNFYFGNWELAYGLAEAGLAAGQTADDPLSTARCFDLRSDVGQLGAPLASVDALRHAVDLARAAGDAWGETDILQKIAFSYLYADRYAEMGEWLDEAFVSGLCDQNPFFVAWHYNGLASACNRSGDAAWASVAEQALVAAQACGELLTIGWAAANVARERLRRGDPDAAVAAIERIHADMSARGASPAALSMIETAAAEVELWSGNWDAAEPLRAAADEYAEAALLVGVEWMLELVALAEVMRGDPQAAATITWLAELSLELDSPLFSGLASLFDGVVALGAGDPERAADAARTALQQWRGQPYDLHVLQALDVVAWASAAGGDSTTAGRLLAVTERTRAERGWAVSAAESSWHDAAVAAVTDPSAATVGEASAVGVSVDDAVTAVLRARGARLRPATGWPSLTPTEREVVALVAEGLSNPDVADRLFMSRSTVKTHLNHVFAKLGISTRAELAAAYVRGQQ
jgi:predicted ATPase/class 3 adenylate cyclase/DNA-binding CsgD family transcriptional regulator